MIHSQFFYNKDQSVNSFRK